MSFRPLTQDTSTKEWVPEPSVGTVMSTAFDLGLRDSTVMSVLRIDAVADFQKVGPKVDPKELNAKYPGLDKPFSRPMTELAAQFIFDETQERREKEEILSRAKGFFKGTVAPFVGGAVGGMSDPIDFGVGAVLGMLSGPLATAIKGSKAGLAAKTGITFAENVVANSFTELLSKSADDTQLQKHTAQQMLTNIIGGALVSTTISAGVNFIGGKFNKLGDSMGPTGDAAHRTSKIALDNGQSVIGTLSAIERGIDQDLQIDTNMRETMDSTFDRPFEVEDMADFRDELRSRIEAGEVTPDQLDGFKNKLESLGVPPEKLHILGNKYTMSEGSLKMVGDTLKSDTDKIGINEGVDGMLDRPPIQEGQELDLNDLDTLKEDLRVSENKAGIEGDLKQIEVLESEEGILDIGQRYAACLFGGPIGN